LKKHPVNTALRVYNEFISLTFKSQDFKREIDMPYYSQLLDLAKKMGITL